MAIADLIPPSRIVSSISVLAWLSIASFTTTVRADSSASQPVVAPAHTSSVPVPAASTQAAVAADSFEKGSRYWSVTAATSRKPSLAWFALTQLHASYYLVDDLAITYGGQFGYVEASRTSGGAFGGSELGMRWHFAKRKQWSMYAEALAGAVYSRYPLTPASLRFNFDLQGGGGATYRVSHKTLLAGGIRAHHLSNARVHGKNQNLGYDAAMLYLELMRSF